MKYLLCVGCAVSALALFCSPLEAQDFTLYDLYSVDLQRGTIVRLTSIPDAGEFNPCWSPDGRFVVHDVTTIDGQSLSITDVSRHTTTPLPGGEGGNDASWSPDGKWIAFDRVTYGDFTIYILPRAGGTPRMIVTDASNPSWNSIASAIAFRRPSDGSIRTVAVRDGIEHLVGYGEEPAWSPDGRWIAFSQSGDIWKVPIDRQGIASGPGSPVTGGPWWDGQPSWSGDSRSIIFHSNQYDDFDIWKVSKDGGTPQRITGLIGAGDYDPAVSLDGRNLVLAAVGPGSSSSYPAFANSNAPFSIVVQPLMGPQTTDIAIRVRSSDPPGFPIPASIKKLQIRVIQKSGRCVLNREFSNIPLNDGQAVVSLSGLGLFQPLRVMVVLPANGGTGEFVVRAVASVILRPDLVVDGVNSPGEVPKRLPFNVEARIKEKNIRVGTRCTVSLFDGLTSIGVVPGVWVPGGSQVSVVFEGIRLANPGVHVLTARITDANPAEYDLTNNEATFSVNVLDVQGVEPMQYSMSYSNSHSTWQDQFRSSWLNYDNCSESDSRSFWYSAYLSIGYGVPGPPFDLFAWKIEIDGGVWDAGSIAGAAPIYTYNDGYYSYESYSFHLNPAKPIFAYLSVSRSGGYSYVSASISQYASRSVYRYSENGTVSETTYEDGWPGMLANQNITTSILLRDEDFSTGGGATLAISANEPYSFAGESSGFDSYYQDTWVDTYSYVIGSSGGYSSGVTDPAQLPLSRTYIAVNESGKDGIALIPSKTGLLPAYPNPFNPATTIAFTVEREGSATLDVYNVLGERMGELFNGPAAPGREYRLTFNGASFPSGIYFARLQVAGKTFVNKILLTK